jgi:hypothetical protein
VVSIYFLIAIFPISIYSSDLLEFLGFSFSVTDLLSGLLVWLAPGILLKLITDCMKTFLFCHKRYVLIGLLTALNIVIISPLAYFRCRDGVINSADIGIVVLCYELLNIVFCSLAIRLTFTEEERAEFCSLKYCIRLELDWFTWEFIKNCFTHYYSPVITRIMIFIVSLTGSDRQINAYGDMDIAMRILVSISFGFYVYPRTKINIINGMYLTHRTDPNPKVNNGLDFFKTLFKSLAIVAAILSVIMCGICFLCAKTLGSETEAG